MARLVYNATLPFGQLISGAVDKISTSTLDIARSADALSLMTPEQAVDELGITLEEYTTFKSRINELKRYLEADELQGKLVLFDQG